MFISTKRFSYAFTVVFGLGPYWLSPASPSLARRITKMIEPTSGTNAIKNHTPPFPISCNLRSRQAYPGNNAAKE